MPKIIKVAKGAYTACDITVDSSGRVITASSGSGGAFANGLYPAFAADTGSGTYTANANANFLAVYARGGGGAGGNGNPGPGSRGGNGGSGGFSMWVMPISQPYAVPYVIAGAGGSTTLNTNDVIANSGGKGQNAPSPTTPGSQGNYGSTTCPTATAGGDAGAFGQVPGTNPRNFICGLDETAGQGGGGVNSSHSPQTGSGGGLAIFENI